MKRAAKLIAAFALTVAIVSIAIKELATAALEYTQSTEDSQ